MIDFTLTYIRNIVQMHVINMDVRIVEFTEGYGKENKITVCDYRAYCTFVNFIYNGMWSGWNVLFYLVLLTPKRNAQCA